MWHFLRDHAVSTTLISFCLFSLLTQSITGYFNYNDTAQQHKQPTTTYAAYLVSGDFLETVGENWEGEFIPLAAYVLLTSFLLEKGAKESRKPNQTQKEQVVERQRQPQTERRARQFHWSERHGPLLRWVYEHSLFLAFFGLFLFSFGLHIFKGLESYNAMQMAHGQPLVSVGDYLRTPFFWLQSTRNWQAGFLSTAFLALFSIFLREKHSPTSKGIDQPDSETGEPEE